MTVELRSLRNCNREPRAPLVEPVKLGLVDFIAGPLRVETGQGPGVPLLGAAIRTGYRARKACTEVWFPLKDVKMKEAAN
jgi:hypothetical protein